MGSGLHKNRISGIKAVELISPGALVMWVVHPLDTRGWGQLIDGNLDWNFHPKLTASFYGGHMSGGDVQRGIYGDGSGAFGYIELTYRF